MSRLTAVWNRLLAVVGRYSMYRLVLLSLGLLAAISLVLSLFGLVTPAPLTLLATGAVLVVACLVVDLVGQRITGRTWRIESSLITAGILLFVLYPTVDVTGLVGIAIAGAVASASKYLIAWRGRHILNPAALGATVLSIITILSGAYALGAAGW